MHTTYSLHHIAHTYCHLWLSGSVILFQTVSWKTPFLETLCVTFMCVLVFLQNFVWDILYETFLILRRIQWDIIINVHIYIYRSSCKLLLFLSDCNETWNFLTHFQKILNYQILRKSFQWQLCFLMQADRHDTANSCFLQFCKRA
jgi:hypothetical protein